MADRELGAINRTIYQRLGRLPDQKNSFCASLTTAEELISIKEPAEVLIEVYAVSLNYRDANILNGTNPWATKEGGIPCSDAAGVIVAVGPKVKTLCPGDRVVPIVDQDAITGTEQTRSWLGGEIDGVLATHIVFHEDKLVKIPAHLSWNEAACLPNAGLTAWSALHAHGVRTLRVGQTVLSQGTGGVSLMATKLALAGGAKVILTSSSDEKLSKVRQSVEAMGRGSQLRTVNYRTTPDWDRAAMNLNEGVGVDVVIENGGTTTFRMSLNVVKKRGVISSVGYLGRQTLDDLAGVLPAIIDKTVTLQGINVGSKVELEQLSEALTATQLRFDDIIDQTFPFVDAGKAFDFLWSGGHVGKVVIRVKD